jgi:hypothetical protein
MVLLSVLLTHFVHTHFIWLTVFIGANLFQQSFTGFCPATLFFKHVLGLKSERDLALTNGPSNDHLWNANLCSKDAKTTHSEVKPLLHIACV